MLFDDNAMMHGHRSRRLGQTGCRALATSPAKEGHPTSPEKVAEDAVLEILRTPVVKAMLDAWVPFWRSAASLDSSNPQTPGSLRRSAGEPGQARARKEDVWDHYDIDKALLGQGAGGIVRRCKDRGTGVARAVKTLRSADDKSMERFGREICIQRRMDHPNIVRLCEVFGHNGRVDLVMELCTGGSLWDRVDAVSESRDERVAAGYLRQLLGAISHLHAKDVVHCDIKPHNVLFESAAHGALLKVIDFGFAQDQKGVSGRTLTAYLGSVHYVAPEVLRACYDEKCDVWSCGVVLYLLLSGYLPFDAGRRRGTSIDRPRGETKAREDQATLDLIEAGHFDFLANQWEGISSDVQGFVKRMLTYEAEKRPSADDCLEHPWLRSQEYENEDKVEDKLEKENEEEYVEIVFIPTEISPSGFKVDEGGVVTEMADGGKAECLGMKVGMRVHSMSSASIRHRYVYGFKDEKVQYGDQPEALRECIEGKCQYTLVLKKVQAQLRT